MNHSPAGIRPKPRRHLPIDAQAVEAAMPDTDKTNGEQDTALPKAEPMAATDKMQKDTPHSIPAHQADDTAKTHRPVPQPARNWPGMALAGLLGGMIGAAGATGLPPLLAVLSGDAFDARVATAALSERIDALNRKLDALPGANKSQIDQLANRVESTRSALETQLKQIAERAPAHTGLNEAERQSVVKLVDQTADLNKRHDEIVAALAATKRDLTHRMDGLATASANAQPADLQRLGRILRLQGLATAIERDLYRGQPYGESLSALRALGPLTQVGLSEADEQILALFAATGAPTAASLLEESRAAASQAMIALRGNTPSASWFDRLAGLASSIVRVRQLGETAADDPGAIIAAAQTALARGDTRFADTAWRRLPDVARQASPAFTKRLNDRAMAEQALRTILQGVAKMLLQPAG
jgi:hypothetical protein